MGIQHISPDYNSRREWEVIYDPSEYGFHAGVMFSTYDVSRMLAFQSWSQGTILKNDNGVFKVKGQALVGDTGMYVLGVSQSIAFIKKVSDG
jgi:hypothetical protein